MDNFMTVSGRQKPVELRQKRCGGMEVSVAELVRDNTNRTHTHTQPRGQYGMASQRGNGLSLDDSALWRPQSGFRDREDQQENKNEKEHVLISKKKQDPWLKDECWADAVVGRFALREGGVTEAQTTGGIVYTIG